MENKTNKAKLAILKFLRKSVLSQGYSLWQNWRSLCLISKFYKNMLIRVFLHTEFISAMQIVQNPTIFMKNGKEIEKWVIFVISVNFLRYSLKLLSKISENVRKYVFEMEKKTNKAKLEILKFLRKLALSQGYSPL